MRQESFGGVNESDDRQPRIAFEVNVRGTYNLLEACRNSPDLIEKAIVASSDKAYGCELYLICLN
jgi:CDP-glucose 4,6-dehydratase